MTHEETAVLTRYVETLCPYKAMDEYTADAWHDIVGHLELADCRAAVVAIKQRARFVDPCDIIAEVKRQRRDRLERVPLPAPPAELADQPGAYREALQAGIRRTADGLAVLRAIGPPPGPPPPLDALRARLGPAQPPPERCLPPEEKARRQVAESRAACAARELAADPCPPARRPPPASTVGRPG